MLLAPVNETVDNAVSPFVAAAEDVVRPLADADLGPSAPLGDTVENSTRPAAAGAHDMAASPGAQETAIAGAVGGGGDGMSGEGGSSVDDLFSAAPGSTGLEDLARRRPDAALSAAPTAVQPPFAAQPPRRDAAAAAPAGTGGDSTLEAIAATATDPYVLAATGVAVLIGAGLGGARAAAAPPRLGSCSPTSACCRAWSRRA